MRRLSLLLAVAFGALWACPWDNTLREYLIAYFWQPFPHLASSLVRAAPARLNEPFAGMGAIAKGPVTPLFELRVAYRNAADPRGGLLQAARTMSALTPHERDEIELLDAKFALRADRFKEAQEKLQRFLFTARTPAYLSEARGWLAHVYYRQGDKPRAAKIYLAELQRPDSNLSHDTLLNSLAILYGYSGGDDLERDLEAFFDTPDHARFAIELLTNPRWDRGWPGKRREDSPRPLRSAGRIKQLLLKHASLFNKAEGANILAILGMRIALRTGDAPATLQLAAHVSAAASVRETPDFLWMLASARYLTRQYAAAETPLLRLFGHRHADRSMRQAAGYGLCGVYARTGNRIEQLRYALWLRGPVLRGEVYGDVPAVEDRSVYWASSGWDFGLLVEAEISVDELRAFLIRYSREANLDLVQYAFAVRLARAGQEDEAALLYDQLGAPHRGQRMRRVAELRREIAAAGTGQARHFEAQLKLAAYLANQTDRLYFNDRLWQGFQRYPFRRNEGEAALPRTARDILLAQQRALQDAQEESWQAHLLLRQLLQDNPPADTRRRAAHIALRALQQINIERFGRESDVRREIAAWYKLSRR